jgi:hypothetical protein
MSGWRWSCNITLKQHVVRSKNSYLFLGNVEKKIVTNFYIRRRRRFEEGKKYFLIIYAVPSDSDFPKYF